MMGYRYLTYYSLILLILIAGCETPLAKNIVADEALNREEGIMISKIRTNVKDNTLLIHGKGEKWPYLKFDPVNAPEDLKVVRIKSGEAYFSKISRDGFFIWNKPCYFNVEPGTVTYVGDFVVEWVAEKSSIHANILTIDREKETVEEAKEKFPWLFDLYPYRKSIPNCEEN